MFSYYTIIKESSPYYFYNMDGSILFQVERKYMFSKYLFTIRDAKEDIILVFEIKNAFFFSKTKILFQNLEKNIILEKKNRLIVEGDIISINESFKPFTKYKSSIILNKQIIGEIREESIFPYKKYLISFNRSERTNYYGIILFIIISVYFADGI